MKIAAVSLLFPASVLTVALALSGCNPETGANPSSAAAAAAPAIDDAPDSALDLSRPLARQQVLDLFTRLFDLPPNDYVNWEEAAKAGRIPNDVRTFHEAIVAFNKEADLDPESLSLTGLPFIELPNGERVYPIHKASLGPILGANVTQEDLNTLLPRLATLQKRILDLESDASEESPARIPDHPVFIPAKLEPDDFTLSLVQDELTDDALAVDTGPANSNRVLYLRTPPLLDGRSIIGARLETEPFTSLVVQLSEAGGQQLAEVTREHSGNLFVILLAGKYHAAVAIGGEMQTRTLQLPGAFSEESARKLLASWIDAAKTSEE